MLKEKIIQSADSLFLKYGLVSVSMQDIASDVGISKKTLYEHIKSKDELIDMIMHNHISEDKRIISSIESESKDAIEEVIGTTRYVMEILRKINPKTLYELKKYYRKIYLEWEHFQKDHIYRIVVENIKRGRAQGLYRDDFDLDILSKLYVSQSMTVVNDEWFEPRAYRRDHVFLEHIKYHISAIATTKGMRFFKKYLKELK